MPSTSSNKIISDNNESCSSAKDISLPNWGYPLMILVYWTNSLQEVVRRLRLRKHHQVIHIRSRKEHRKVKTWSKLDSYGPQRRREVQPINMARDRP
jgi:hypothetical protein